MIVSIFIIEIIYNKIATTYTIRDVWIAVQNEVIIIFNELKRKLNFIKIKIILIMFNK